VEFVPVSDFLDREARFASPVRTFGGGPWNVLRIRLFPAIFKIDQDEFSGTGA
jgi:hypothetical protein